MGHAALVNNKCQTCVFLSSSGVLVNWSLVVSLGIWSGVCGACLRLPVDACGVGVIGVGGGGGGCDDRHGKQQVTKTSSQTKQTEEI